MFIFKTFRLMAFQSLKMARFGENGPKWAVFRLKGHKTKTTEDEHTKLYIFEISVKFCVDWYMIRYVLKMFKIFLN